MQTQDIYTFALGIKEIKKYIRNTDGETYKSFKFKIEKELNG